MISIMGGAQAAVQLVVKYVEMVLAPATFSWASEFGFADLARLAWVRLARLANAMLVRAAPFLLTVAVIFVASCMLSRRRPTRKPTRSVSAQTEPSAEISEWR